MKKGGNRRSRLRGVEVHLGNPCQPIAGRGRDSPTNGVTPLDHERTRSGDLHA